MAKTEKNKISEQFKKLRDYGFKVINNNTPGKQYEMQKGWVDYVIFNERFIVFIEVKLEGDKFNIEQLDTMAKLKSISSLNGGVLYFVCHSLSEAKEIVDYLLANRMEVKLDGC